MAETPSHRRETAILVRACLTEHRITHALAVEAANRRRKLSLVEIDILEEIGRSIPAVREELAEMPVKAATKWLATKFDEHVERLEISERREKRTAARRSEQP
jgi:hypothetical protein